MILRGCQEDDPENHSCDFNSFGAPMLGHPACSMRNYAMSIRRLADREIALDDDCDEQDEDQTQDLVLVLRELLDRLSLQLRGAPTALSKEVERWEGGGYLYLETVLTDSAIPEIDVSIQGGRALVRMAQ
jgi:hypothetical protein